MQLSVTERERLYAILEKYDQNPKVQQMREFIQHGDVTTYQHCKNVVLVSCWLNHRLHLGADETSLAVGAFLHDFYLYDWHKKGTFHGIRRLFEMHGFSHPGCACVNAEKVFHITKKEQSIISSHMWPLTFRHVPTAARPSSSALPISTALWWKVCSSTAAWLPPKTPTANTTSGKTESSQITGAAALFGCSGSFCLIRREKSRAGKSADFSALQIKIILRPVGLVTAF